MTSVPPDLPPTTERPTKLAELADPAYCPRLVVKVGSALLVGPDGEPRCDWMASLVAELAELKGRGQQIVLVSSGAIALGAARLGLEQGGRATLADAQAAAAVGQIALSALWSELLAPHGLIAAQMLVTLEDLEGRRRYLNAAACLGRLAKAGAVPVINENDSIATHEIRFGDNDRLAARVAQAARAQGVLLLSDIDGLYDRNPADPEARLIPQVKKVTGAIHAMADGGSKSGMGSGGMTSKLQAAEIAGRAGIALAIINGKYDGPIGRATGSNTGTLFLPGRRDGARKSWLGGRQRFKGRLSIDAGAAQALQHGKSLLAPGITFTTGTFDRGDAVAIEGPDGSVIAHGLAEYNSAEIRRLMGHQSADHAVILGYVPRSAVVHRDHMVLL